MATFKICIFRHQEKKDRKFPVYIRVCWKRKYGYINTGLFVTRKQIRINNNIYSVKDPFVISELDSRIAKYEELKIRKIGYNIELYSAVQLAEYFKKQGAPGTDTSIDFIEFAGLHCERLAARGKQSTARPMRSVINAMIDFCNGRRHIPITEITSRFLYDFELFLQKERTLRRKNQHGKVIITKRSGLSRNGIFDYMVCIRTLFNAARAEYNDEDKGDIRITHYPFRKYKLKKGPDPVKRALSVDQVRKIINSKDEDLKYPRAILARDVFKLSFCLAGINLADLYDADRKAYTDGRFSYNRKKTRDRRQDGAYISVKVFPEILPLIEKYRDKTGERVFSFANMYANLHIFSSNVNKGLKRIAEVCKIDENLTSYYARFSFATIARNDCGISKDDINLALDHVDPFLRITDIYIKKDWSIIDRAVRTVLDLINEK